MRETAIVIGAGIVGLATARALAIRGYKVTVVERNQKAVGASIRNFGMIWPIGQPSGVLYERALLSRNIWKQLCDEAKLWYDEAGSLHVAYNKLEEQVLEEFCQQSIKERDCHLLTAQQTTKQFEAVQPKELRYSLYSPDELIVDPRVVMEAIPGYLHEKFGVEFLWGSGVTELDYPVVKRGEKSLQADEIFICNGADFETLFPEYYSSLPITKCKLQMMRLGEQPGNWRIGPALCGGLSLIHYKSFETPSLFKLKQHFQQQMPLYLKWGIHVMSAQNKEGQVTVGDSHEYASTHDPFDKLFINEMILNYLNSFARLKNNKVIESWNGIYPKLTDGRTEVVTQLQPGVTLINGLGGAGMTLSFGLCEQVVAGTYQRTDGVMEKMQ